MAGEGHDHRRRRRLGILGHDYGRGLRRRAGGRRRWHAAPTRGGGRSSYGAGDIQRCRSQRGRRRLQRYGRLGRRDCVHARHGQLRGSGRFAVTGGHAYAEEGSFTATVAIKDAGGATVSTTTAVIVVDQPLSATGIATLKAVAHASTGTLTVASFADGDPGGTANDYAATI